MALIAPVPKASQSGHYYYAANTEKSGQPCYEVPCKSRPGEMRPTNIKDCRALNLVPSVTQVLKSFEKPGLRRYFDRMMFEATYTTPRIAGESDEEHFARCLDCADEHSRIAREQGTAMHTAIECALDGRSFDSSWDKHVAAAITALEQCGIDTKTRLVEHSFASPLGFGGKTDLIVGNAVVDFKRKLTFEGEKKLAWDENAIQLSAYSEGLEIKNARRINVFISIKEGEYRVHEWEPSEHERHWGMFKAALSYWKLANKIV